MEVDKKILLIVNCDSSIQAFTAQAANGRREYFRIIATCRRFTTGFVAGDGCTAASCPYMLQISTLIILVTILKSRYFNP